MTTRLDTLGVRRMSAFVRDGSCTVALAGLVAAGCGGEAPVVAENEEELAGAVEESTVAEPPLADVVRQALATAEGCLGAAELRPGAQRTLRLKVGNLTRSYLVHVGTGLDPSAPAKLIVNFHGFMNSPAIEEGFSQMDVSADRSGYVVAYPQGVGASFNAGGCCGSASFGGVDDVAFARKLVADVSSRMCIDRRRIFATGFSNGGYMSYRLACEAADLFAAVAPVAGTNGLTACHPSRPVPLLAFNGLVDNIVSYRSGHESAIAWAARNGCEATPERRAYGTSYCEEWTHCSSGAPVTHCSVAGLWHLWPGNTSAIPATDAIAEFFDRNPLP